MGAAKMQFLQTHPTVKPDRAKLVLGWMTALEYFVL